MPTLVGWLAALAIIIGRPDLWRHVSMWLVTFATLCELCWFLAPGYSETWRGIASNDNLALLLLMLLFSLGFGVSGQRPDARSVDPSPAR